MSQPSAGLDDLLSYDDGSTSTAGKPRTRIGGALRMALAAAALTAVTLVGLRMLGVTLPSGVVAAGWLAMLAVGRVSGRLRPSPLGRRRAYRYGDDDEQWRRAAEDVLHAAVRRWERRLAWSQGKPDHFNRFLPAIGELVDDRLRQRHGLTRGSDPRRARALLGERAWSLLASTSSRHATPRHTPSPQDLAAIIAELEKI